MAGQRVDVTEHPYLAPCARTIARMYDAQHEPAHQDLLTMGLPDGTDRVSAAYRLPHSTEDLVRRRELIELHARRTGAVIGRPPDFLALVLLGLWDIRGILAEEDPRFGPRAEAYFQYCRDNDLCVAHGFGDVPRDRHLPVDVFERLQVVDESEAGIVLRGARAVATLSPFANEYLGLTSPRPGLQPKEMVYFASPLAAAGIHIVCRRPLPPDAPDDHPLLAIGDEMDAMVVFDDVFVPAERVFYLRRADMVESLFPRVLAWASYHMLTRMAVKAEILCGIGAAMADYLGTAGQPQTQDLLCELILYAETLRAFLYKAEHEPVPSISGLALPDPTQVLLARTYSMQHHPRILQIVRDLCGSGLLMAPGHADIVSPDVGPYITRFLVGADERALARYRFLKLAWDYTGDSFATRQLLLELHAGSTLASNKARVLRRFDPTPHVQLAKRLAGLDDAEKSG